MKRAVLMMGLIGWTVFGYTQTCTLLNLSVIPADTGLQCTPTNTSVDVTNTETGISYYLRNDLDDSIVDGPKTGTGGTLTFSTGLLANTTRFNVIGIDSSISNNALNFEGITSSQYVDIANIPAYNDADGTVEFWMRPTWISGTGGNRTPVGMRIAGDWRFSVHILSNYSGIDFCSDVGCPNYPYSFTPGAWYHVALVVNGTSNTTEFFINGTSIGTQSTKFKTTTAKPFRIGFAGNVGSEEFQGDVHEVRYWDHVRSGVQISSLKDSCLTGGETGLIGYWPLNDGTGSSAADLSSYANNGTLTAMDTTTDWVASNLTCGTVSVCTLEMTQTATISFDSLNPMAACQDITISLDASGNKSITTTDVDGGSSDACGIDSLSISTAAFTCADTGVNMITLSVSDSNGNASNCVANVTVEDNTAPVVTSCPTLPIYSTDSGQCSAALTIPAPSGTDACGVGSIINNFNSTSDASDTYPRGFTIVTWTLTDANGNTNNCIQTIFVVDDQPPLIACPSNITVSTNPGVCQAYVTVPSVMATDNCGVGFITNDNTGSANASSTYPLDTTVVLFTVPDLTGNSSQCTVTIIVEDNEIPTALCQDLSVYLDSLGNASITATNVDSFSYDACGVQSLALDTFNFTCSDAGLNTVTLTVTDIKGNTNTCLAAVSVFDTISPVATCQDITIQLDSLGNASVSPSDIDNGSADACTIDTMTISKEVFGCADTGVNSITLVVSDPSSNSSACVSNVAVEDNFIPTAICMDVTIYLDSSGAASITTADIDASSFDACGIDTMTLSTSDYSCANIDTNFTTLTVTDIHDNSNNCVASVIVKDTVSPAAVCLNKSIYLDSDGLATIGVTDIDNGSADACGIDTMWIDKSNFECSDIGSNSITLSIIDVNNNGASCIGTFIVYDTISPTAICQDISIFLNALGHGTASTSMINNMSNDACGIETYSLDMDSFICANVGANTITLSVIDSSFNSSTCTSTVSVIDSISPTMICQDISVYLDNLGQASITPTSIDDGSSDACTIDTITVDLGEFDCSHVGMNSVTLTATDVNSNSNTCSATVSIFDTIPPNAICQDITIYLSDSGQVSIEVSSIDVGSNDACSVDSMSIDMDAFDCSNINTNTVTLTVIDSNNNSSFCSAIVTVWDTVSPTVICQDLTIYLDSSGNATISAIEVDNGSSDACNIASMSLNDSTFQCSDIDSAYTILTVKDSSANRSHCSAIITVLDTVSPNALCMDVSVYLDNVGSGSILLADLDNGSNDACGIKSIPSITMNYSCSDVGIQTETLTIIDTNSNSSSCQSSVTVIDTVPPVAVCKAISVFLDTVGSASIEPTMLDDGSNDACGILSLEIDSTAFDCAEVGMNTVTLTVTDSNNNVNTCQAIVNIYDTISPVAVCKDLTIYLDGIGTAQIAASDLDNSSYDNCKIDTIHINQDQFDCSHVGNNTVTLTVTDVNANDQSCNSTVIVVDTIPPDMICTDITIYLDVAGNAAIAPDNIDNGSSDACGIDSSWTSQDSFICSHVGANSVILTASDSNGNSNTCTAMVTVVDTISPVAICQDITIQLDSSGHAAITPNDINDGSNDACGIDTMTVVPNSFTCNSVDSNIVTLTVVDINQNNSVCIANVFVEDLIAPQAICQDLTVYLDDSSQASITASDLDNGSNDVCGLASFTASDSVFNCSYVGANPITLTIKDVNGNTSSCMANVFVEDTLAPIISCPSDIFSNNDAGNCGALKSIPLAKTGDNCGVNLIENDYNGTADASGYYLDGTTLVTYTVTDVNNNTAVCQFEVNVSDTEDPTITCPQVPPASTDLGLCSATILVPSAIPSDNCGILITFNDHTGTSNASGVYPEGFTTVTWTTIDSSGNSSSCLQVIYVVDNEKPVIQCPMGVITNSDMGSCGAQVSVTTITASDNCGIGYITNDYNGVPNASGFYPEGITTVNYQVFDIHSNISTCSFTVTVNDAELPVATCQDITVTLDPNGLYTITGSDIDAGSADACGVDTMIVSQTDFTCVNQGSNSITLTVTDIHGNSSSCSANVYVISQLVVEAQASSIAVCDGNTVTLNGFGAASYIWDNSVSDGIAFTPASTLIYSVTGTDANGCVATDTISVTVQNLPNVVGIASSNELCLGESITLYGTGADTYSWSHWIPDDKPFVPNSPNTYDVTVTGTDLNGCQNYDTLTVLVHELPIITASATAAAVCKGDDVTLSATGASNYTWNYNVVNATPFIPDSNNVYEVIGIDTNGCSNKDQIAVGVYELPVVEGIASKDSLCLGDFVTLAGTGADSYSWSNGINDNVAFVPVNGNLTYAVMGTDLNGCSSIDSVSIVVHSLPNVVGVTSSYKLCLGDSVTLYGTGAATYTWSNWIPDNKPFVPTLPDIYDVIVTGTDLNGCQNVDSLSVVVHELPIITANSTANAVCSGEDITLSASGATNYTWNNNVLDATPFIPDSSTTYEVIGIDTNGCSDMDQVFVDVYELPIVEGIASKDTSCFGDSITLVGTGADSYIWSDGVNDNVAFVPVAGNFTYSVIGTDVNGCSAIDQTTIQVHDMPLVTAYASKINLCKKDSLVLTASGADYYSWDNNAIDSVPFAPPIGTITYTVVGTSKEGCSNEAQIQVTVNPIPKITAVASNTIICKGEDVILSGFGAFQYNWTDQVLNGMPFVPPLGLSSYGVIGIDINGCSNNDSISITVLDAPEVALNKPIDDTVCTTSGLIILPEGTPAGGTYYGKGVIGNTFDPAIADEGNHDIRYEYTDSNGCSQADTIQIAVKFCATGIQGIEITSHVTVFPNPTAGVLNLSTEGISGEVRILLRDIAGQVVIQKSEIISLGNVILLNIHEFAGGVYYLDVYAADKVWSEKIIKYE